MFKKYQLFHLTALLTKNKPSSKKKVYKINPCFLSINPQPRLDFLIDEDFLAAVFHARIFLDGFGQLFIFGGIPDGFHGERTGGGVADVQFDIRLVVGDAQDILFGQIRRVFLGEIFRVFGADFKAHHRADVTKDGVAHTRVVVAAGSLCELGDVLVRHDKSETVFAGFGQNCGKSVGGEILELIDIEIEILALFLGHILAAHGRHVDLVDENKAEELGVQITDFAFRQIDEEDFLVIHDFTDVEGAFGLADDIADSGVRDERAEFRAEVRDHFLFFAVAG